MKTRTSPVSLSELRFVCTRAAVGAGAPFGLGEDFADAAIAIAKMGFDAAQITLSALNRLASGDSSAVVDLKRQDGVLVFEAGQGGLLSSIFAGPTLCDHLIASDADCGARLINVDSPLLAVAGLEAVSVDHRTCMAAWETTSGDGVSLLFENRGISRICAPDATAVIAPGPVHVEIRMGSDNTDAEESVLSGQSDLKTAARRTLMEGLQMDAADWAGVYAWFERCLVPSSEESMISGAGAGLVDTD